MHKTEHDLLRRADLCSQGEGVGTILYSSLAVRLAVPCNTGSRLVGQLHE